MKTLLKTLFCLSLFAAPLVAQTIDFIGPFRFCRPGQCSYFQVTAGRTKNWVSPRGWQLLVSANHVRVPWSIPGPILSWPPAPIPIFIYLHPDAMFCRSAHNVHATPKIFSQFRGELDAKGQGALEVRVPNNPLLIGQSFWMQVVLTWVPYSQHGLPLQATNPLQVWIAP